MLLLAASAIAYIDRVTPPGGTGRADQVRATRRPSSASCCPFQWAFTARFCWRTFADWRGRRISFPLGVVVWRCDRVVQRDDGVCAARHVPLVFVGIGESAMIPSGARVIRETFDLKRRALVVGTFFAGNKWA